MPRITFGLLRSWTRHALVVAGIALILATGMTLSCAWMEDAHAGACAAMELSGGTGGAPDGDDCGHCLCVIPGAVVDREVVALPASHLGSQVPLAEPGGPPRGVTLSPDPPPDRA